MPQLTVCVTNKTCMSESDHSCIKHLSVCYRGVVLNEEEKDAIGTAFAAETNRRDEDTQM